MVGAARSVGPSRVRRGTKRWPSRKAAWSSPSAAASWVSTAARSPRGSPPGARSIRPPQAAGASRAITRPSPQSGAAAGSTGLPATGCAPRVTIQSRAGRSAPISARDKASRAAQSERARVVSAVGWAAPPSQTIVLGDSRSSASHVATDAASASGCMISASGPRASASCCASSDGSARIRCRPAGCPVAGDAGLGRQATSYSQSSGAVAATRAKPMPSITPMHAPSPSRMRASATNPGPFRSSIRISQAISPCGRAGRCSRRTAPTT